MSPLSVFLCLALFVFAVSAQRRGSKRPSKQAEKNDGRIVGGRDADISQFPYQVSIQELRSDGSIEHLCGGSIIAPEWILTAAYCFKRVPADKIEILAGTTNLKKETDQAQRRKASMVISHPDYNPSTNDNDIALVKLDKPFTFNGNVQSIPIDRRPVTLPDQFVVTGWGSVTEFGRYSDSLQTTRVPVISRRDCLRKYQGYGLDPIFGYLSGPRAHPITENMMCAGFEDGIRDSCDGDNGGPAISYDTRKQAGIYSWGRGCARRGWPGVYTKLSNYISWIDSETGLSL